MKYILASLFALSVGTLIGVICGALNAAVFYSYWGWFFAPLGLPQISYFHAWGIILAVSLFSTPQPVPEYSEREAIIVATAIFRILFAWIFGFVIHLLMQGN